MENIQQIFNLDKFFDGNASEQVDLLRNELVRTGFCLVDISRVKPLVKDLSKAVKAFFDSSSKHSYNLGDSIGYMSADWKESFRAFSGKFLEKSKLPLVLEQSLRKVLNFFDNFFKKLLFEHCSELFEANWTKVKETADSTFGDSEEEGFGMLDYVKYTSSDMDRSDAVMGHADPGLLSFSLFSDKEGLMLLDREKDAYINVPLDMGVIWVGEAGRIASDKAFQTGFHKVSKEYKSERQTFWFEVCSNNQLSTKMIEKGNIAPIAAENTASIPEKEVKPNRKTEAQSDKKFEVKVVTPLKNFTCMVSVESTMGDLKKIYERKSGITVSKSMQFIKKNKLTKKQFPYENDMLVKDCLVNGVIDFSGGEKLKRMQKKGKR